MEHRPFHDPVPLYWSSETCAATSSACSTDLTTKELASVCPEIALNGFLEPRMGGVVFEEGDLGGGRVAGVGAEPVSVRFRGGRRGPRAR